MQLMVLYHHRFYYYNTKLEVVLVPGVCSGLSGKGEGNSFDSMQGNWDALHCLSSLTGTGQPHYWKGS